MNVEYQVDSTSGIWAACTADDGIFDELTEDFTCSVGVPLRNGSHTIYVRATDSKSNTTISGAYSSDGIIIAFFGKEITEEIDGEIADDIEIRNINNSDNEMFEDTDKEDIKKLIIPDGKISVTFGRVDDEDIEINLDKYSVRLQKTDILGRPSGPWFDWIKNIDHKSKDTSLKVKKDGYSITYKDGNMRVKATSDEYTLKDGVYFMRIKAFDKAGNSVSSDKIKLVIDSTKIQL